MSRSFKKTPICGYACASDKKGKQQANRKFRRIEKSLLKSEKFENLPMKVKEIFDTWDMPKDGKGYFFKLKFKDLNWYNKLMRK